MLHKIQPKIHPFSCLFNTQIQDFLPFFGNNREKAEIFSFAKKFMQSAFLSDTDMPERNIFSWKIQKHPWDIVQRFSAIHIGFWSQISPQHAFNLFFGSRSPKSWLRIYTADKIFSRILLYISRLIGCICSYLSAFRGVCLPVYAAQ